MSGREQVRDNNSFHVDRSGRELVALLIDQRKIYRTIAVYHRLHCARMAEVLTALKLFDRRERRNTLPDARRRMIPIGQHGHYRDQTYPQQSVSSE